MYSPRSSQNSHTRTHTHTRTRTYTHPHAHTQARIPRNIQQAQKLYLVLIHQHNRIEMLRVHAIGRQQFLPYLALQGREAKSPAWVPIKIDENVDNVRAEPAFCIWE